MKLTHRILVLALSLTALLSTPAHARDTAPEESAVRGNFGTVVEHDGEMTFHPTRVVPIVAGMQYGWIIVINSGVAQVAVRQELTLAAKPASWGDAIEGKTISRDGKTCTLEAVSEVTDEGFISCFWEITEGDPIGMASLKLFVEDEHVVTFQFRLAGAQEIADDEETPKPAKAELPQFLQQQMESLKTALTTAESSLMRTDTAIKVTALRVQAARQEDDPDELRTGETHLSTLSEERKNIDATIALLERAMKEMEQCVQRRKAVARENSKAAPVTHPKPKRRPSPSQAEDGITI